MNLVKLLCIDKVNQVDSIVRKARNKIHRGMGREDEDGWKIAKAQWVVA